MKNKTWPYSIVELFYPLVELTVMDAHGAVQEVCNNVFLSLKRIRPVICKKLPH